MCDILLNVYLLCIEINATAQAHAPAGQVLFFLIVMLFNLVPS